MVKPRMTHIEASRDAQLITGILNEAFATVAETFGFTRTNAPKFPAFIDSSVIQNQLDGDLTMFVCFCDGVPAGCAGYSPESNKNVFAIERLGVLPAFRHLGIGRQLLTHCERHIAASMPQCSAKIYIVNDNAVLKRWYTAMDYVQTNIIRQDGYPFDICVMEKQLYGAQARPPRRNMNRERT
ncbi:MAG: hypothetical protein Ta2A_05710 [Treponemataceae bacterium]|nr:MAG: hypothetical protein Ta2A_05710 [Treponemataceae bacterium]